MDREYRQQRGGNDVVHSRRKRPTNMKDHISNELSKVMTAVAATNASIAAVENFVKTEFATLQGKHRTKQGTADTRGDVQDPPQIDELDGNAATGEDDVGGSVATKGDEIVTKKTTLKPSKAGRPVRLTTVAAGDGFKRYSKRERHSPDRFTPGGVPRKQETAKRLAASKGEGEGEGEGIAINN
ncbi:hypothetical protein Bca4012_074869 [Brassica carinata]